MSSPNKPHTASAIFVTLLLMLAPTATILAADAETRSISAEKEIQIRANHMKFDLETGSSTYKGDVKINQGGIELSGEKIVIYREHDEIQKINVDGQPARYIQDENSNNRIYATSQHMEYLAAQNRLIMTVDARLEQPDHTIESQRIVYDTKNKVVIAGDAQDEQLQGGRVNITLTPKKDKIKTPADTEANTENK